MSETKTRLPAKKGRRSVQTAERAKIICDSLARGLPYVHACAVAGISFQTFSVWRSRDENFRQQIEEAIASGVSARLAVIEKAAGIGSDWRAAAWLLEHCQPEHFAKSRVQAEVSGHVQVEVSPPKAEFDYEGYERLCREFYAPKADAEYPVLLEPETAAV